MTTPLTSMRTAGLRPRRQPTFDGCDPRSNRTKRRCTREGGTRGSARGRSGRELARGGREGPLSPGPLRSERDRDRSTPSAADRPRDGRLRSPAREFSNRVRACLSQSKPPSPHRSPRPRRRPTTSKTTRRPTTIRGTKRTNRITRSGNRSWARSSTSTDPVRSGSTTDHQPLPIPLALDPKCPSRALRGGGQSRL